MSGANGSAFGLGALVSQGLNAPEQAYFKTADPIMLGSILLDNFEIPSSINWGGTHKLTVHTLPGGERIIDAMGRDEEPITWSAIFLGQGALDRAKQFDVLRAAGNRQQFLFGTLSYTVIISSFKADYKFRSHIPYSITLQVVLDNAAPVPDNSVGAVSDDVSSAGDAIPQDAPANVITKTKAETGPGTSVTKTFQPIDQTAPTVANANIAAGNNLPTSAVSMVDLGPASSLSSATPDSLVTAGIAPGSDVVGEFNVFQAQQAAQVSADSLSANAVGVLGAIP